MSTHVRSSIKMFPVLSFKSFFLLSDLIIMTYVIFYLVQDTMNNKNDGSWTDKARFLYNISVIKLDINLTKDDLRMAKKNS